MSQPFSSYHAFMGQMCLKTVEMATDKIGRAHV